MLLLGQAYEGLGDDTGGWHVPAVSRNPLGRALGQLWSWFQALPFIPIIFVLRLAAVAMPQARYIGPYQNWPLIWLYRTAAWLVSPFAGGLPAAGRRNRRSARRATAGRDRAPVRLPRRCAGAARPAASCAGGAQPVPARLDRPPPRGGAARPGPDRCCAGDPGTGAGLLPRAGRPARRGGCAGAARPRRRAGRAGGCGAGKLSQQPGALPHAGLHRGARAGTVRSARLAQAGWPRRNFAPDRRDPGRGAGEALCRTVPQQQDRAVADTLAGRAAAHTAADRDRLAHSWCSNGWPAASQCWRRPTTTRCWASAPC